MSNHLHLSQHHKLSNRFHRVEPTKSVYSAHHAIVNCDDCNRTMVPRVVSYYGQPLKSICPFCGNTFAKFPSGFSRFIQYGYSDSPSFSVLKKLATMTIGFVMLWFIADWGKLSDGISLLAGLGVACFLALVIAELGFQAIERIAAKFYHQSNYYWAILVLLAMLFAHEVPSLAGYVGLFFLMIIARGLVARLIQPRKRSIKSTC